MSILLVKMYQDEKRESYGCSQHSLPIGFVLHEIMFPQATGYYHDFEKILNLSILKSLGKYWWNVYTHSRNFNFAFRPCT